MVRFYIMLQISQKRYNKKCVVLYLGPLNSWNRMPFLTKVAYGYPSFDAAYNLVKSNFVFGMFLSIYFPQKKFLMKMMKYLANYGGSQSFDTDDGSAWHRIEGNVFYDAMAYKNDYGGFNVDYINNMNIALNGGTANSWGIGPVNKNGPGNLIYNNKIIVYQCPNRNKNNPTAPCGLFALLFRPSQKTMPLHTSQIQMDNYGHKVI